MFNKPRFIIAMVVLLIGAALTGIAYTNIAQGQKADRFREEIERLEGELKNTDLSEEGRKGLELSLESLKVEATHRAAAYLKWTQISSRSITPIPTERYNLISEDPKYVSRLPDGISNIPRVPRPLPRYDKSSTIISSWRKTTPDRYYVVYAGYITTDTKQGMVLVFQDPKIDYRQFLTPGKSGAVRIVAEKNLYLVLQAENGDMYYFDAAGERFIDSLDTPTITPTPSERIEAKPPAPPYPAP